MLGRVGDEGHAGGEDVVHLRVVPALDKRGPVDHLEIDVHAQLLQLLLGDEGIVVQPAYSLVVRNRMGSPL